MNIAIVHFTLNALGGAEKLCLTTVEALKSASHRVTLVTVEKTDWKLVERSFGKIVKPDHEVYFGLNALSRELTHDAIAFLLFVTYLFELLFVRLRGKYDLVINTYGDLINSMADITYVHFPIKATVKYSQFPPISSARKWSIYNKIYTLSSSLIDKVGSSGIVLTNSSFVKHIVKEFLNREAVVIFPPVDVETFSPLARNRKRENIAITVSGYSPKRHLEQIPHIAKHTKSAKFIIAGKADEYSISTLKLLKRTIKALDVEDHVKLMINVPRPTLQYLLSRAKVYLHVMPNEHFGTAIVEAMASGCVPIVHQSGGPWLDILDQEQGKYGYAFRSPREAAEYIETITEDEEKRKRMASAAFERSMLFDRSVFERRIAEIAEKIYVSKYK